MAACSAAVDGAAARVAGALACPAASEGHAASTAHPRVLNSIRVMVRELCILTGIECRLRRGITRPRGTVRAKAPRSRQSAAAGFACREVDLRSCPSDAPATKGSFDVGPHMACTGRGDSLPTDHGIRSRRGESLRPTSGQTMRIGTLTRPLPTSMTASRRDAGGRHQVRRIVGGRPDSEVRKLAA